MKKKRLFKSFCKSDEDIEKENKEFRQKVEDRWKEHFEKWNEKKIRWHNSPPELKFNMRWAFAMMISFILIIVILNFFNFYYSLIAAGGLSLVFFLIFVFKNKKLSVIPFFCSLMALAICGIYRLLAMLNTL